MTDQDRPEPVERAAPTEQERAIAALVGRYIEAREHHEDPRVPDLFAAAEEFGDVAVDVLGTLLAGYEAMRATRKAPADGPTGHPIMARPDGRAGGGRSARQRGGPPSPGEPHGHRHPRP